MREFGKLQNVVDYIRQDENVESYRWMNAAADDWDIDDIQCNVAMYDETYNVYRVDVKTYDIYSGDGEELFSRVK